MISRVQHVVKRLQVEYAEYNYTNISISRLAIKVQPLETREEIKYRDGPLYALPSKLSASSNIVATLTLPPNLALCMNRHVLATNAQ